ncbi:cytochrome b5 domain-containing protein 1 [Phymastichus coffea]|uniref:cytochrome b5 domain-containing protein 1 n=1 Tax=Phymastichus coffea TaxID=108790 RepID=UPI00273B9308|nr:cytochrome b5 domain-containing protein 1 [Phymastichus coffea]
MLQWLLPAELVLHKCWLSCRGYVYDLAGYIDKCDRENVICMYLLAHAGKDVSYWFDASGRHGGRLRLRRYVEPATGQRRILLPYAFPIPEGAESTYASAALGCCSCRGADDSQLDDDPARLTGKCWSDLERIFNGTKCRVGRLTRNARPCKITNVLTGQQVVISVCEEDTINRIRDRAMLFNRHGASYTWKFEGKKLNPELTLTDNGIPDEREVFLKCGLPEIYTPNLLCYYNDDLTEDQEDRED